MWEWGPPFWNCFSQVTSALLLMPGHGRGPGVVGAGVERSLGDWNQGTLGCAAGRTRQARVVSRSTGPGVASRRHCV